MIPPPLIWLGLNLLSVIVQAFYSSMEMACVSFNKVRLQYFVSKKNSSACLLNDLLNNSYRLFGTTLIGVNVALVFGSEFSRLFNTSLGINPDFAPLTQVTLVVIFGELAPMFAARRYAEHMVMLGIRLVYASSLVMSPFLWAIRGVTHLVHMVFGGMNESSNFFLSQEELQNLIEERREPSSGGADELDEIVANIFNLRQKYAWQIMTPLTMVPMIPSNCTVANLRNILKNMSLLALPVYHKKIANIVGIALPRDLIRENDNKKVREKSRQPWFITQDAEILYLLGQFRKNNQTAAIVLNEQGLAVGMVTLEDVFEEIFGKKEMFEEKKQMQKKKPQQLIEKTFPGDMMVSEFNRSYGFQIKGEERETLSHLIARTLGHTPEEGDAVIIPPFEMSIKEASLLEVKTISIRTII